MFSGNWCGDLAKYRSRIEDTKVDLFCQVVGYKSMTCGRRKTSQNVSKAGFIDEILLQLYSSIDGLSSVPSIFVSLGDSTEELFYLLPVTVKDPVSMFFVNWPQCFNISSDNIKTSVVVHI
ncbi:MAG: hypothetical protein BGP15_17995 [Sphingobacterium sp. 40-24]|nr:MAG: hypothetical protein BGP15_17995 [Sphingobacterium sp. 40-24]